jgi:hypothetical protein
MSTNLQILYDAFFAKTDENFTGKEGQVFKLVDSAISKSYKTVVHDLSYILTNPKEYEGHFNEDLDKDEIELLALWMVYEWNRKKQQKLIAQRRMIGTKDFNRLGNLKDELKSINETMVLTLNDINSLKNEFNTYKYN